MNSSCGGASIGDTCMVFCAEGYQAVSNDTSTCDVIASSRVDFSKCFSLTCNETCVVRCYVGYPGVDDKNTLHLQGSLEFAEESSELSTVRALAERDLPCDDHFVETQVQTTAASSLWQKGRVGQPSRRWRTKTILQHEVAGVCCQLRGGPRAESKSWEVGNPQHHECLVSK